jgi:hypothetical protein
MLDDIRMEANIGTHKPCQRGGQIHQSTRGSMFQHPDGSHHPQPAGLCDTPGASVVCDQQGGLVFVREQDRLTLPRTNTAEIGIRNRVRGLPHDPGRQGSHPHANRQWGVAML